MTPLKKSLKGSFYIKAFAKPETNYKKYIFE